MCFCCLSQPLKRTFWNSVSTDRAEPSPSNWSCSLMSPSTYSLTNQSNSILIHQDSAFLTNRTARIWSSHLRDYGPIKDQKWRHISASQLLLGLGNALPFHLRLTSAFPWQGGAHRAGGGDQSRAVQPKKNLTPGLPCLRASLLPFCFLGLLLYN